MKNVPNTLQIQVTESVQTKTIFTCQFQEVVETGESDALACGGCLKKEGAGVSGINTTSSHCVFNSKPYRGRQKQWRLSNSLHTCINELLLHQRHAVHLGGEDSLGIGSSVEKCHSEVQWDILARWQLVRARTCGEELSSLSSAVPF